jgi:hypothetical protein
MAKRVSRALKRTKVDVTKHGVGKRRHTRGGLVQPDYVAFRANVASRDNQYEHIHVEAGAFVKPGEDAMNVLSDLQAFVADKILEARDGQVKEVVKRQREGGFHESLRR